MRNSVTYLDIAQGGYSEENLLRRLLTVRKLKDDYRKQMVRGRMLNLILCTIIIVLGIVSIVNFNTINNLVNLNNTLSDTIDIIEHENRDLNSMYVSSRIEINNLANTMYEDKLTIEALTTNLDIEKETVKELNTQIDELTKQKEEYQTQIIKLSSNSTRSVSSNDASEFTYTPTIKDMTESKDIWYTESLISGTNGYVFPEHLQAYTYQKLQEANLTNWYPILLSLFESESGFNPSAVSQTNDYGIAQINKVNHSGYASKLGLSDEYSTYGSDIFLNPYVSIDTCVLMLQGISWNDYSSIHSVLMVYNQGGGGAKTSWNNGIYQSAYSQKVVSNASKYGWDSII